MSVDIAIYNYSVTFLWCFLPLTTWTWRWTLVARSRIDVDVKSSSENASSEHVIQTAMKRVLRSMCCGIHWVSCDRHLVQLIRKRHLLEIAGVRQDIGDAFVLLFTDVAVVIDGMQVSMASDLHDVVWRNIVLRKFLDKMLSSTLVRQTFVFCETRCFRHSLHYREVSLFCPMG
ncbi:hypothetical protein DPMN_065243 [Dreissena polymorpha]|uniref:Uncharacterized protein n=1 Tax=Dreissena polymorpha TaxID=45954 RepID=A0A9D4CEN3_DREPO|nr:hypothetical protein DPMN_065243 [Dreissena polymorpha]